MTERHKPRYENPIAIPRVLRQARAVEYIPGVEIMTSRYGGTVIRTFSPLSYADDGSPRADFYDIFGNREGG